MLIRDLLKKPRYKKVKEVVSIIDNHYWYLRSSSLELAIVELKQAESSVRTLGDQFKPKGIHDLSRVDLSWWFDYYQKTQGDCTFEMWVKQYRQEFYDLANRHQKVREALEYYLSKQPT